MIELGFYEKVVKLTSKSADLSKKLGSVILTAALIAAWVLFCVAKSINAGLMIFVLIFPVLAEYMVLQRLETEFEISVNENTVTLSKIFSKRNRRTIFSVDSKYILFIAPLNDQNMKKAEDFSPKERYEIIGNNDSDPAWIIVFEDKKEERSLFTFSAEQGIIKIFKKLKPSALNYR